MPLHTRHQLTTDQDFIQYCQLAHERGWISVPGFDQVKVEDISGNINRVRRLEFQQADGLTSYSLVVKTVPSAGRLEKYPEIQFPEDRLVFEANYYRVVQQAAEEIPSLKTWVPELYHYDVDSCTLLIENIPDQTVDAHVSLQNGLAQDFINNLAQSLAQFHQWGCQNPSKIITQEKNLSCATNLPYVLTLSFEQPKVVQSIWQAKNEPQTLFALQAEFFEDNGVAEFSTIARQLENALYDFNKTALIHGDLHSASIFVRPENQPTVIDAELCEVAAPWFDVGMLYAHLTMLSAVSAIDQEAFIEAYLQSCPELATNDFILQVRQLAGFEMIRRIIGPANVTYLPSFEIKRELLTEAVGLIQR